jgi:glycerol-3-phosphate dehydrogenase
VPWPLPGSSGVDATQLPDGLDAEVKAHLLHLYGSLAAEVVAPGVEDPSLLERLDSGGPDIAAQALYASTHEWARRPDDVIRRRTTLFYRGLESDAVVDRVESLLDRS